MINEKCMKEVKIRMMLGCASIMFYPLALAFDFVVWGAKIFELEFLSHLNDRRLMFMLIFSIGLKFLAFVSTGLLISIKHGYWTEEEDLA